MDKKAEVNMEQRILEVAEGLFLENGFAQTSTTDIARKAGCNHALLHYYYRTKENLFQKIFESKVGLFIEAFAAPYLPDETFENRLRRSIEAHFDVLIKNPRLPMLILSDMANKPERVNLAKEALGSFPQELFARLDKELEVEIAKGTVRPMKGRDLVMNILSLNIFTFISLPLFAAINDMPEDQFPEFLEYRKRVIADTILQSIRP